MIDGGTLRLGDEPMVEPTRDAEPEPEERIGAGNVMAWLASRPGGGSKVSSGPPRVSSPTLRGVSMSSDHSDIRADSYSRGVQKCERPDCGHNRDVHAWARPDCVYPGCRCPEFERAGD